MLAMNREPMDGWRAPQPAWPLSPSATAAGGSLCEAERCFLRHAPELFLASSLFQAAHVRQRRMVDSATLETLCADKTLRFSGETLDQSDLDALLACLTTCLEQGGPTNDFWRASPELALKRLGRRADRAAVDAFVRSLTRLEAARIEVRGERYRCSARLITRLLLDTADRTALIEFDSGLLAYFLGRPGLAALLRQRRELARDGLAKWLLGVGWATSGCFAVDLDRLKRLCGRETAGAASDLADFDRELRAAMERLQRTGAGTRLEIHGHRVVFDHGGLGDHGVHGDRAAHSAHQARQAHQGGREDNRACPLFR